MLAANKRGCKCVSGVHFFYVMLYESWLFVSSYCLQLPSEALMNWWLRLKPVWKQWVTNIIQIKTPEKLNWYALTLQTATRSGKMCLFHFLQITLDTHTRQLPLTPTTQHRFPPIDVFLQWEQKWQPFTLNITACTCGEGLGRFENSRGPAQAPAERRGHKPCRVVTAAAARHFLDVLHVLWKNTSLSASNVKSTALLPIHKRMWVTH